MTALFLLPDAVELAIVLFVLLGLCLFLYLSESSR